MSATKKMENTLTTASHCSSGRPSSVLSETRNSTLSSCRAAVVPFRRSRDSVLEGPGRR